MTLLRRLWQRIRSTFQVILMKDGEVVTNEKNQVAYVWLWEAGKHVPACKILHRTQTRDIANQRAMESLAPIAFAATIDMATSEVQYVAPVTLAVGSGHMALGLFWWGTGRAQLSLLWEDFR